MGAQTGVVRRPRPFHPAPATARQPPAMGRLPCNRRACLAPRAIYWNRGSYAYYCARCAWMLNNSNSNTSFVKEGGPMCRIVLESEINKPIRQSRD